MNAPTMTRKERRAVQFGTAQERAAIKAKYEPRKPFYVKETDGKIVIPVINDCRPITGYMMPYQDIPEIYSINTNKRNCVGTAVTPSDYQDMLTSWFCKGLQYCDPVFRPLVEAEAAHNLEHGFKRYVAEILNSLEPSHEHKFAYLVYVCSTCCESIKWMEQ